MTFESVILASKCPNTFSSHCRPTWWNVWSIHRRVCLWMDCVVSFHRKWQTS